ncbi:MAG: hypothetical protein H0X24_09210 [Ktedonobacterales bacterium]|nr:hypothetical protein [Ktedonobacterales bacterium]
MQLRILRLALIPFVLGLALATPRTSAAQAAATLPPPTHYLAQYHWGGPPVSLGRPSANLPGNFPFQVVKSANGLVAVHYYNQSAAFARQVITQIAGYVQHPVADTLGYGLKSIANIYLYNSREDFLVGTSSPDSQQIGAFTVGATSSIYMPIYENGTNVISYYLPHELTHLVFHQNNDSGHVKGELRFYPLWLDEGMAASDELPGGAGVQQYQDALAQIPFQNIFAVFVYEYPASDNVDIVSYAEARTFILFLEKTYGMTAFHQFVKDLAKGDYNLAMQAAFGADLQTIRSKWQVSLGQAPLTHDKGPAVVTPVPGSYTPNHLGGSVTQTTPYAIHGQEAFISGAVIQGLILTLIALLGVVGGWLMVFFQRRRSQAPTPPAPMGVLAYPPYPPTGWQTTAPEASGAPAFYSPPSAAYTPVTEMTTQVLTAVRAKPLPSYPWPMLILAAIMAPLVVGIETGWPAFAPAIDWTQPYRVAFISAILLAIISAVLGVIALTRQRFNPAHAVGVAVAVLLAITAISHVRALSLAQGQAYEADTALALAHQFEQNGGASPRALARIDNAWANSAASIGDLATQITHLRAALVEDPTNALATTWHATLNKVTDTLGKNLIAGGQYAEAQRVYDAQAQSTTCLADCQPIMQQGGSAVLLAWSLALLEEKDTSGAMAKLQLAASHYSQAAGGKSAARVIAATANPLKGAISAANDNDQAAAALLAFMAYQQNPHTATAVQATEISAPVKGTITKNNGGSVVGDQVFFLGFTKKASATAWLTTAQTDNSDIKITGTIGEGGKFTALLPPGYWYILVWDDPTQQSNYYFNYSRSSDSSVFFVNPFFTNDAGITEGA